ncbi:hypothetical protein Pla163_18440 [Planctomycetes bacterium Pla163]|uniref:Uncharacterized protein n=1 Tax=Rohdeia mirabilis TaxID=2528008 RepID=A0A518CZS6_9BACT|nr:hypothetical protein Pla163_18440 [Planctomycetes bacterium Pla163]
MSVSRDGRDGWSATRQWILGVLLSALAGLFASADLGGDDGSTPVSPGAEAASHEELGRLRAENARLRLRLMTERARAGALLAELERQGQDRLERELAWRDFQGQLSRLRLADDPAADLARALGLETVDERREKEARRAEVARSIASARAKADQVRQALNARLVVEGYDGFEIFDAGVLAADRERLVGTAVVADAGEDTGDERADGTDGDAASQDGSSEVPIDAAPIESASPRTFGTGPVVVRLLDHRGVLSGSLRAEWMHLEASRSGHSVTIVLTGGVHQVGREAIPFTNGVYRIPLRHVDPKPFLEDCGPLFDPALIERRIDDGRWSRPALMLTLNRLLSESDRGRTHRLTWLGGVVGDELRDVEISIGSDDGSEERRLIADGMRIEMHGDHVRLVLRDGLVVAGDGNRTPFAAGTRSIVLVGSVCDRYRAAHLPIFESEETAEEAPTEPPDRPREEGPVEDPGAEGL